MTPGQRTTVRSALAIVAFSYALMQFTGLVHAQSSLGIGASEAVLPSTGFFSGILNWINTQQQTFYRALSGAMRSMRDGNGGAWLLVGVSFLYGVFHAAGPGHGKAVISSYMLANEVALRRGILLSFVSAALQAVSAIMLMGAVFLFLRGTAISMTDATRFLEIASYVLVTAFGAWLLWRKGSPVLRRLFTGGRAHSLSAAHVAAPHLHHEHHPHHDNHHEHGEHCGCGHSHAPDPELISGDRFDWRTAWTAVLAVGLRPCTGALIVLSFAFLNGLWAAGVASVFAMALGTAITVSALAVMAVTAKNWAVAFAGEGRAGNRIQVGIEIAGAAFVFLLGIALLSASLMA